MMSVDTFEVRNNFYETEYLWIYNRDSNDNNNNK